MFAPVNLCWPSRVVSPSGGAVVGGDERPEWWRMPTRTAVRHPLGLVELCSPRLICVGHPVQSVHLVVRLLAATNDPNGGACAAYAYQNRYAPPFGSGGTLFAPG